MLLNDCTGRKSMAVAVAPPHETRAPPLAPPWDKSMPVQIKTP